MSPSKVERLHRIGFLDISFVLKVERLLLCRLCHFPAYIYIQLYVYPYPRTSHVYTLI